MKRLLVIALMGIAGMLFLDSTASAQIRTIGFGPKAGIYIDGGDLMIGAVGEFPISPDLTIEPGAELVFAPSPNVTRFVADANIRYSFQIRGSTISPFVMGGLGFKADFYSANNISQTATDLRLNLGGGLTFATRSLIQPWGGLKLYFLDGSDVALQGGVNFYLR